MKRSTKKEHGLVTAMREVLADLRGEITLPGREVEVPAPVDIAAVRKNLGYTQKEFALKFGFAISALKDWEQGRRRPERSARILLAVIATNPQAVQDALKPVQKIIP